MLYQRLHELEIIWVGLLDGEAFELSISLLAAEAFGMRKIYRVIDRPPELK